MANKTQLLAHITKLNGITIMDPVLTHIPTHINTYWFVSVFADGHKCQLPKMMDNKQKC